VTAMGESCMGLSNEDEEVKQKRSHANATSTTSIETTSSSTRHNVDALNTIKVWGHRPNIQLFCHTKWTTNTSF
jgi:hypothetical protein